MANAVTASLSKLSLTFNPDINLQDFGKQLADMIQESVRDLIEGAYQDLATFAQAMANDTLTVIGMEEPTRSRLLNEIVMQARLIGEINRLRAVQAAWDTVIKVLTAVLRTAFKLIVPI